MGIAHAPRGALRVNRVAMKTNETSRPRGHNRRSRSEARLVARLAKVGGVLTLLLGVLAPCAWAVSDSPFAMFGSRVRISPLSQPGADAFVDVAADEAGNVVAVWNDSKLHVARSTDGGHTWARVAVHPDIAIMEPGARPRIETDGSRWVIVWPGYDYDVTGRIELFTAYSDDAFETNLDNDPGGKSNWCAWTPLSGGWNPLSDDAFYPPDWQMDPDVATDGTGKWRAIWATERGLVCLAALDDDPTYLGEHFVPWDGGCPYGHHPPGCCGATVPFRPLSLEDWNQGPEPNPFLAVDINPSIATNGTEWVAAWSSRRNEAPDTIGWDVDVLVSRSSAGVRDPWSMAEPLHDVMLADGKTRHDRPRIAWDGSAFGVAWYATFLGTPPGPNPMTPRHVFFSRSVDASTWTMPVDLPSNDRDNVAVDLAADRTTGLWIAAWAAQQTTSPDFDIYHSYSTDGGVTWTASRSVILDAAFDTGSDRRPAVALRSTGALVAWISIGTVGGLPGSGGDVYFAGTLSDADAVPFVQEELVPLVDAGRLDQSLARKLNRRLWRLQAAIAQDRQPTICRLTNRWAAYVQRRVAAALTPEELSTLLDPIATIHTTAGCPS